MTTASEHVFSSVCTGEEERLAVQIHLQHLIESSAFAGSRRSQAFLRYVVEETLAGRGHDIKERNIATDVFGKDENFNSQTESIVRVNAGEVRKRLKQAYESGLGDDVHIELPLGSYHPVFHSSPAIVAASPGPAAEFTAITIRQTGTNRLRDLLVAGACTAAVLLGWGWVHMRPTPTPLDLMWQPFVQQKVPVLISLPSPTVFELTHRERWPQIQSDGILQASELGKRDNYYVGIGAAFGAARFAEQLTSRQQAFFLKFGGDVAFADLQRSPAILLGGYSSLWTLEMTRTMPFHFEKSETWESIVDSSNPSRSWGIARPRNSADASEGYAIVSRLMNSESGHPILIAAGLTPNDTQAAAEFLTNPSYFEMFAKTAAADWAQKNFQVVLHNNIHGHSPGSPTIVASQIW